MDPDVFEVYLTNEFELKEPWRLLKERSDEELAATAGYIEKIAPWVFLPLVQELTTDRRLGVFMLIEDTNLTQFIGHLKTRANVPQSISIHLLNELVRREEMFRGLRASGTLSTLLDGFPFQNRNWWHNEALQKLSTEDIYRLVELLPWMPSESHASEALMNSFYYACGFESMEGLSTRAFLVFYDRRMGYIQPSRREHLEAEHRRRLEMGTL